MKSANSGAKFKSSFMIDEYLKTGQSFDNELAGLNFIFANFKVN